MLFHLCSQSTFPTPQQTSSPSSTPGNLHQDWPPPGAENTKMKRAPSTDSSDRRWASGQVISAQLTPPAMLSFLVCVLVERQAVCWEGRGHKCYNVPGADPVKTCKSEQYYHLLLPKSLELPFKNACRARSSQATMWVLLAPRPQQEKHWKTNSNLSSLVICCHQAVSVTSAPVCRAP